MLIFRCKMCGGDLEVQGQASVGTCQHCGTTMTIPRIDTERRANLYDRAGHFRRANDFDKAIALYERLLEEDPTDAEASWCLFLCKYGIEYVEDPQTHKRVPTCNRTQATSVYADKDYQAALSHADSASRAVYEAEAGVINQVLRGILDISAREKSFDVFLCYKETDEAGRRTLDSVLAQDLYYQLSEAGLHVFFSRITLEDKLGIEYEPYIFAALNTARVMVVLGTRPEHFRAVWVRNEWSRYLGLIQSGNKKTLIPAYRDMNPYDLPEEFSHLQALDMGKLGFIQDLLRGIRKILQVEDIHSAPAQPQTVAQGGATAASLLDRAFLNLEYEDWDKAHELLEQVLNMEPRNARAYVGQMMWALQISHEADLAKQEQSLSHAKPYQKALRFADDAYRAVLEGYEQAIADRALRLKQDQEYLEQKNRRTLEQAQEERIRTSAQTQHKLLLESMEVNYTHYLSRLDSEVQKPYILQNANAYMDLFNQFERLDSQVNGYMECQKWMNVCRNHAQAAHHKNLFMLLLAILFVIVMAFFSV